KYARCHWLQVLGLGEHYARAELDARVADDGTVDLREPTNVTRFAVVAGRLPRPVGRVRVGGAEGAVPAGGRRPPSRTGRRGGRGPIVIGRGDGRWAYLGSRVGVSSRAKYPGVQGPIDDAFTRPFLCVRGTGTPWNPAVQAYADASLKRFAAEWPRFFRGELP